MFTSALAHPALQLAQFDQALAAARQAGLNASRLEIRPPVSDDRAWTVNEIDRRWPTQVDAVAIDGATMQVVDRTRFADFPLMAKLTRWGVDFHMGVLFGLVNQLLLVGFGCALCVTMRTVRPVAAEANIPAMSAADRASRSAVGSSSSQSGASFRSTLATPTRRRSPPDRPDPRWSSDRAMPSPRASIIGPKVSKKR